MAGNVVSSPRHTAVTVVQIMAHLVLSAITSFLGDLKLFSRDVY